MNINDILKKKFEDLTENDQRLIVYKLQNRMMSEFNRNDRQGVYSVTQKIMAYNSNKLEGNTLTSDQTASLFDTNTIYASNETIRAKDIEGMHGHFFIFYDMLKTLDLPLSEPLIKAFHYRLKAGSFDDYANGYIAGEYKKISNICNNLATVKPREVPDSMESLLTSYNRKPTHTIMDFARFHADFEK